MAARAETPVYRADWRRGRVASWLTTVDHKRIGILYIGTALGFFAFGGLLALLMRDDPLSPSALVDALDAAENLKSLPYEVAVHPAARARLFALLSSERARTRREALVETALQIAKAAAERMVRHDAGADLVCDQHHRCGRRGQHRFQALDFRIDIGLRRLHFVKQLFVFGEFAHEGQDKSRFARPRAADQKGHQMLTPLLLIQQLRL